ncbi:MAG: hypothetical protein K5931_03920 [Lachnospiraceae bacterium]|nr:hypothetical protein [Lachnospiraceae bacterium]
MKGLFKGVVALVVMAFVAVVPVKADAFSDQIKRSGVEQRRQYETEVAQSKAWATTLKQYDDQLVKAQNAYKKNFVNEIYKSCVENVRINKQLLNGVKDLTKGNPNYPAAVNEAQNAVALAEAQRDMVKLMLDMMP